MERAGLNPAKVFYFEDFTRVEDGVLPAGWTGGEHLAVAAVRNKRVLRPFELVREHKVVTAAIERWAEDWRLEWVLRTEQLRGGSGSARYTVEIGNLSTVLEAWDRGDQESYFTLHHTKVQLGGLGSSVVRIGVEKWGAVFKAYVDGREVAMIRMPGFRPPRCLTFSTENAGWFCVERIAGVALGESWPEPVVLEPTPTWPPNPARGGAAAVRAVSRPTETRAPTLPATPVPTDTPRPRMKPGSVFFAEDFSNVGEGLLPVGWIGGEHLGVVVDGGKNVLQPFERSEEYRVQTREIAFWPDDFRLEWVIGTGTNEKTLSGLFQIELGAVVVQFQQSWGRGSFWVNNSRYKNRDGKKSLVELAVEKRGPVVKGFVDGYPAIVLRLESFEFPRRIVFSASDTASFSLQRIEGTAL
jgi:hypothetical protein